MMWRNHADTDERTHAHTDRLFFKWERAAQEKNSSGWISPLKRACGFAVKQAFHAGPSWVRPHCGSVRHARSGRSLGTAREEKNRPVKPTRCDPKGSGRNLKCPPRGLAVLRFPEKKAWIEAGSHLDRTMHLKSAGGSFCQGSMRFSMTSCWLSQREKLTKFLKKLDLEFSRIATFLSTRGDAFSFPSLMVYVHQRQFLSSCCQRQKKKAQFT